MCVGLRGSVFLFIRLVMRRRGVYFTCGLSFGFKKFCVLVGWLVVIVFRGWVFLSLLFFFMDWRGWYLLRFRFYDLS